MRGFFAWFDIKNFMDTHQECHAFCEGVAEGFCGSSARYEPAEELLKELMAEHHYYNVGRAVGFAGFIVFITGMVIWAVCSIIRACAQL